MKKMLSAIVCVIFCGLPLFPSGPAAHSADSQPPQTAADTSETAAPAAPNTEAGATPNTTDITTAPETAGEKAETPAPSPAPEASAEKPRAVTSAEELELRGEEISAQMEYVAALHEALGHYIRNEEAEFHLAEAEFLLEKLLNLSARTGENRDLGKELGKIPGKYELPPLLAEHLWRTLMVLSARAGDAAKAREYADKLHYIRSWQMTSSSPEDSARAIQVISPDGALPLGSFYPDAAHQRITLRTIIDIPAASTLALRLSSGAAVEVRLNRRSIFTDSEVRIPGFDCHAVALNLLPGKNLLELEFSAAGEFAPDLYARLSAPEGGAPAPHTILTGEKDFAELPKEFPEAVKDSPAAPEITGGATQTLAAIVKQQPRNSRAAYYLGYLLSRRQTLGASSPYGQQLLMQAARDEPQRGIYYLAAATASPDTGRLRPDRDENLRRMILLRALSVDEGNVAALNELAEYYLDSLESPQQAQSYINRALEKNPQSPRAGLLQCRIFRLRGWLPRAYKLAGELARRNPGMPAIRLQSAELSASLRGSADAVADFKTAYETDRSAVQPFLEYLQVLEGTGQSESAQQLLENRLSLYPYDTGALERLIMLQLARKQVDMAAANVQRLLEINPRLARAHELRGRILQLQGKEKESLAEFARALELAPASGDLRDYLAYKGESQRSPLTEIADLGEFAQRFEAYKPPAGEDEVYLLREQCDELHLDGTKKRTIHLVIRILDQQGAEKNRRLPIWYDQQYETVQVDKARVLHADGSSSIAQTVPISRPGDRQVVLLVFPALAPGDIIEAGYSINQIRRDFFGDYFGHIHSFSLFSPVLLSRYVLISPKERQLYFHRKNGAPEPETEEREGMVVRTWQMSDLPAVETLPLMPPVRNLSPLVEVSTFRDWDALAKWYWELIKDQNIITEQIREQLTEILDGADTPDEKLRAIYQWVMTEIRNNAWEFGVHGYKPYNADAIFTRRFGDCKDKATLINVLAREAGLEAWPILLRSPDPNENDAGRAQEDLTLPLLAHFNHCISLVKAGERDYYLDGTHVFQEIESVPFTNAGAQAVVVRPEGAQMLTLPPHTPEKNLWQEDTIMRLDARGAADFEFGLRSSGQGAVFLRSWFRDPQSWDNVMRGVSTDRYGHVSAVVVEDVRADAEQEDTMLLRSRVRIRDYARLAGDSMTFRLPAVLLGGDFGKTGALPGSFAALAPNSRRSLPLILPSLFQIERRVRLEWPDGWRLSEELSAQELDTPFGTLKVEYTQNLNILEVTYKLVLSKLEISPEEYREFRRFCLAADQMTTFAFTLEKE